MGKEQDNKHDLTLALLGRKDKSEMHYRSVPCGVILLLVVKFIVGVGDNGGDCHGDGECH